VSRVGIFGGQFDPPHLGHLAVVRAAREQAALDAVIVIPDGTPPHRVPSALDPATRVRLARAAFGAEPAVTVSVMALDACAPVFMADKLERLANGRKLFLLLGADQYAAFDRWRDPQRIRRLAALVVAPRSGFPPPAAGDLALAMSPVDCASSELREALARGEDVRDQLPDAVWEIIERERLYG
jgi:nicotinate-nucleotide adenylyltransferase